MTQFLIGRIFPLLKSGFVRNAGGMMTLTALGQGLYLLVGPLIGRLYSPEQIGLYGLFFTIVATLGLFVSLLYDFAIPAAASDEDARDLTIGSALLALILSPIAGLILTLLCLSGSFGLANLPPWSGVLLVLILLAQVALQLAQAWRIRQEQALVIGRAGVTLNASRGLVQVILGIFTPMWWALGLGELIGRLVGLWHVLKGRFRLTQIRIGPIAAIRATLARYREFPVVLLPAQALDATVVFAQIAGLSLLYGPAGLGQYFLMRRTLDLPIAFASRSLADLFYARLAADARTAPQRIRPFFTTAFLMLVVAGFIGGLPVILFGPQIFVIVYGRDWALAGALAAVMTPAMVLNLAVAPVSKVFALTTKPHLRLVFGVVSLVGSGAVLIAASRMDLGILQTTIGLSIATCVSFLIYFLTGYLASAHIRTVAGSES